jgi:hypothetical protein
MKHEERYADAIRERLRDAVCEDTGAVLVNCLGHTVDLIAEVRDDEIEQLRTELEAALAMAPTHRRGDFGPGYQRHASPENMASRLAKFRRQRAALDRLIERLDGMYAQRKAEGDAGVWPYRDGAGE